MSASALLLRTKSYTPPKQWREEDPVGLRDNILALGRTRYTAGENVLAQADSEKGALHVDSAGRLRIYRADATGDSSEATRLAKTAILRAVHHYDDFTGDPTSTVSVEGDLYVRDAGSSNAWLESYDGSTYRGLGVLAENRTTATSGSPSQNSDDIRMRSQVYADGSTQNRDWLIRAENFNEEGSFASFLSCRFQLEGSPFQVEAWRIPRSHVWLDGEYTCLDDLTFDNRAGTVSIGRAIDEGFSGSIRTRGGYDETETVVARHNHIDIRDVATSGGATVGDACVFRFDVAAGTHKAVDAGTGNTTAWVKDNLNGTVVYGPRYATKDETPKLAHALISVFDGSTAQTLTSAATWYQLEGFDTDGIEYNATANAASNQIDITQDGLYQVHFTGSLRGDANEVYLFRIIIYTDNPSNPSIDPSLGAVIGLDTTILGGTVAIHGLVDLVDGDSVVVEVFNPSNPSTTITPAHMQLSVTRIG